MNLLELLSFYREADVRVKNIIERIDTKDAKNIYLKGIVGSALSFVACGVYKNTNVNHLFILNDRGEAAYFLNDLQNLLEKKDILFIPDSFKKPGEFIEVNTNHILQRTEAINKITHSTTKGELIITYPEALAEKFVMPEVLDKNIILLKKGEKLDSHFIVDLLVENGFVRTDFVYEPGQFSVRGGIIDIFSFGNELPYRVELFDNEVESIRVFEPATQLSQKSISQVTIIPNIQSQFGENQKTGLFNCLPENTVVWFKDAKYAFEVINQCYEKAIDWFTVVSGEAMKKSRGVGRAHLDDDHPFREHVPEEMLLQSTELLPQLMQFKVLEFGLQKHFESA